MTQETITQWANDQQPKETFAEKVARIKATAKKVNKAIGLPEDALFNNDEKEEQ